jgi:putative chitinase
VTQEQFLLLCDKIAGRTVNRPNAISLWLGMQVIPGEMPPHELAQFMAQVTHENMDFTYDREIWSPSQVPAQARYDTRVDLGNTPILDGDGFLNRGMGPIQLTGGGNRRAFAAWCRDQGLNPPNFVETEALLTDPWEGLSAVWYWLRGNPTGQSLGLYADTGNIEAITRKVNGGLNGYEDRCRRYTRAALVLLGMEPGAPRSAYETTVIKAFQKGAGLDDDGISGLNTRAALHSALKKLEPVLPVEPPAEFKIPAGSYVATVNADGSITLLSRTT